MSRQKSSKFYSVVSAVVVLLLVLALIGGVMYLTNGGKDDIKTFSVQIGERLIMRDESGITLASGETISVNSSSDYTVSVYAYAEQCDFSFLYGEERMKWSDCTTKDFLNAADSGLSMKQNGNSFVLSFESLQKIISSVHDVVFLQSVSGDIFRMSITSAGSTIDIYFGIGKISAVTGVALETDLIEI